VEVRLSVPQASGESSVQQVDDLPAWTDRAVFIHGARKAGTTVLVNLHDGSDEMIVFPTEVKLKQLSRLKWGSGDPYDGYYSFSRVLGREFPNFDAARYEHLTTTQRPALHSLRDALRLDAYLLASSVERSSTSTRMWAMKEVGGNPVELASLFRCLFFDGKIVMIVRDPRMVTRAFLRSERRVGVRLSIKQIADLAVDPVRTLAQQLALFDDESIHFVIYEDLVDDTETVMRGVADYLGIDYTPAFEVPTIFGEPVVVKTSSRAEKKVFHDDASWSNGLTAKEVVVVAVARTSFRVRGFLRRTRAPRYDAVCARLRARGS